MTIFKVGAGLGESFRRGRVLQSRVIYVDDHNPYEYFRHKVWRQKSGKSCRSNRAILRQELKVWEREFAAANGGRKAGRDDIKQHPSIGMAKDKSRINEY